MGLVYLPIFNIAAYLQYLVHTVPNRSNIIGKTIAALALATVGYYLYLMVPGLHHNLWNDEVYTLRYFTLVPLHTVLTDYHVPNNHVLYSIFNHLYLKAVGIGTLRMAMEQVAMVRLPLLVLSVGTLLLLYRTGKLAGGQVAGLLAMALLATNIPYQNFAIEVRGYSFSLFLDLLLVYASLQYLLQRRWQHLVLMVFTTWAAVYTVPINLYCVMGILAMWGMEWLRGTIKQRAWDMDNTKPIIAVMLGVLLALACYLPMFKDVFNNSYVNSPGVKAPVYQHLWRMIGTYCNQLIEGKVVMHVLFLLSTIAWFAMRQANQTQPTDAVWKLVVWQYAAPLIMVTLRGESPPDRVFVYLSPMAALLAGVTFGQVIQMAKDWRLQLTAVVVLVGCVVLSCTLERKSNAAIMASNLQAAHREQGLQLNYYLQQFEPLAITHYLEKETGATIVIQSSEPRDIPEYLEAFNIPFHSETNYDKVDSIAYYLQSKKVVYAVSMFPGTLAADFEVKYQAKVTEVLPPAYHHLYRIEANP